MNQCCQISLEYANQEINKLRTAIINTLNHNKDLADGDCCTLMELKYAVPEWDSCSCGKDSKIRCGMCE